MTLHRNITATDRQGEPASCYQQLNKAFNSNFHLAMWMRGSEFLILNLTLKGCTRSLWVLLYQQIPQRYKLVVVLCTTLKGSRYLMAILCVSNGRTCQNFGTISSKTIWAIDIQFFTIANFISQCCPNNLLH